MSDQPQTTTSAPKWRILQSEGRRSGEGYGCVWRAYTISGDKECIAHWRYDANSREIAAQLRALADMMEAADNECTAQQAVVTKQNTNPVPDYIARQAVMDPQPWDHDGNVTLYNWRNHVGNRTRALWPTFLDEVKIALAGDAEEMANSGNWDIID